MSRGEPVAVAYSAEDETRIEQLLLSAKIAYVVTLDATEHADVQGACALGCVYEVESAVAENARSVLEAAGFASIVLQRRET